MFGDQRAGQEGIMLSFLSPQRVESNLLRGFRNRRDILQMNRGKCGIEFHSLLSCRDEVRSNLSEVMMG